MPLPIAAMLLGDRNISPAFRGILARQFRVEFSAVPQVQKAIEDLQERVESRDRIHEARESRSDYRGAF